MRKILLLLTLGTSSVFAGSFGNRFEEIKRTAKPAELYTFLYALPKGGDLHNHLGGAIRSEWWYEVATDPARNGGDAFYTRTKFTAGIDTGTPLVLFQTIRKHAYDALPAERQADFVRLDALTPAQKDAVLVGLDGGAITLKLKPGFSTKEFFELVLQGAMEGFFADPLYGGNKNMAGWKMIGFPGARYDYRDHIDKHNVPYPRGPVSIYSAEG